MEDVVEEEKKLNLEVWWFVFVYSVSSLGIGLAVVEVVCLGKVVQNASLQPLTIVL